MPKLLVPVDGSEVALRAVEFACRRVKEGGGEIVLLHVDAPPGYEEVRVFAMREDFRRVRDEATRRVLEAAEAKCRAAGVRAQPMLREGEVGHAIADAVTTQSIDELVMGTRGMGAFGSFILGSVASRVVHLVHVPVTLIR